jgi:hypothetical protein
MFNEPSKFWYSYFYMRFTFLRLTLSLQSMWLLTQKIAEFKWLSALLIVEAAPQSMINLTSRHPLPHKVKKVAVRTLVTFSAWGLSNATNLRCTLKARSAFSRCQALSVYWHLNFSQNLRVLLGRNHTALSATNLMGNNLVRLKWACLHLKASLLQSSWSLVM